MFLEWGRSLLCWAWQSRGPGSNSSYESIPTIQTEQVKCVNKLGMHGGAKSTNERCVMQYTFHSTTWLVSVQNLSTAISSPILSRVLLHNAKVAHLHCSLATCHSEVVLGRPACVGHDVRDKQLYFRLLTHIQQNSNHLLFDGLCRVLCNGNKLSQTLVGLVKEKKLVM